VHIFLIVLGTILLIIGFIGSFLPIVPGPPIAYLGLLTLIGIHPYSVWFFVIWALVVIGLQVLDHTIPPWMTKKIGGSKYGIWGSIAGLIAGFFFPPFGIVIGPLAGAFLGELLSGRTTELALRSAWGSFLGFLLNTVLKVIAVGVMAYYFIAAL
jgi:uncharacterized protein YqgC (DUF456 family)